MRSIKLVAMACTVPFLCTLNTAAHAEQCTMVAAIGDGLTNDIATLMSTNGLKNIIEGKGMKGKGPITTKCEPGTFMPQCTSSQMACK